MKLNRKQFECKCTKSMSTLLAIKGTRMTDEAGAFFNNFVSQLAGDLYDCKNKKVSFKNPKSVDIKVKYFSDAYEGAELEEATSDRNWIDLRAKEDIFIPKNTFALIPLGVAIQLPKGYEAHIVPRSSTFKTWGIIQTNSMGVVDETYCGDKDQWYFPAFCIETKDIINGVEGTYINKGDRICQFRIMPRQESIKFTAVKCLNNEDRGGFGTTGNN